VFHVAGGPAGRIGRSFRVKRNAVLWSAAAAAAGLAIALTATPSGAAPKAKAQPSTLAASAADRMVSTKAERFHTSAKDEISRQSVVRGHRGLQYVSYNRTYAGLPVWGGDFVVVTNSSGKVLNTSVSQKRALAVETTPAITPAAAQRTARAKLNKVNKVSKPQLKVMAKGSGRLVYDTLVSGVRRGKPSNMHVFVDAKTGKVAHTFDLVRSEADDTSHYHGTVDVATGETEMTDPNRPNIQCGDQTTDVFTGEDSKWGNGEGTDFETACVDTMFAVQKEWDMLGEWLGRNGIDGEGGGFPAHVGLDDANAFWDGSSTTFGRNQAGTKQATPYDVVAHEYGHAIFQETPGGPDGGNGNEKGGMNESAGDIFGALTEAFAAEGADLDEPDYLVGEEVDLVGDGPIRDMANPESKGDPNCFSEEIPDTEVHAAAGPQNHWFYLLAEGSAPTNGMPESPTCDGSTVTGIGVQKAGQIFMGGLNAKTTDWSHAAARVETVNAAKALFEGSTAECEATKAAWTAVSVPEQEGEAACA
jgi:Zn-dependent metalloprotease